MPASLTPSTRSSSKKRTTATCRRGPKGSTSTSSNLPCLRPRGAIPNRRTTTTAATSSATTPARPSTILTAASPNCPSIGITPIV